MARSPTPPTPPSASPPCCTTLTGEGVLRRRAPTLTTTGITGERGRVGGRERERGFFFFPLPDGADPQHARRLSGLSLSLPLSYLSTSLSLKKKKKSPLFVTWDSVCPSSGSKSLRGCIGSLSPQPLASGLRSYALTSALRDRRFPPVQRGEVPALHCTVSLLRAFEEGLGWDDWVPGRHGIIIEFEEPDDGVEVAEGAPEASGGSSLGGGGGGGGSSGGSRSLRSRLLRGGGTASSNSASSSSSRSSPSRTVLSATYLPHVAPEQGWGVDDAIRSLVRKAGFGGKVSEALKRELRLTRYEISMAGMGWREYQKEREKGRAGAGAGAGKG